MNYSVFEGSYRRIPQQNLAGASKSLSREQLLQKTRQDRLDRQLAVKKNECAIAIQAFYRGYLSRSRFRRHMFEVVKDASHHDIETPHSLSQLGSFIYMYKELNMLYHFDTVTMISKQIMLHYYSDIINEFKLADSHWMWKVKWLLKFHLNKISSGCIMFDMESSLKTIDVFTNTGLFSGIIGESKSIVFLKEIMLFLVENGFYSTLYSLMTHKFVEDFGTDFFNENVEGNKPPRVPKRDEVFDITSQLVLRTLSMMTSEDHNYRSAVMREFCKTFLTNHSNDRVVKHIFPVLFSTGVPAVSTIVDLVGIGKVPITTSCLYVVVEFFKKGYRTNFSKIMEALMVLLGARYIDPINYPGVTFCNYIFFETNGSDGDDEEDDNTTYCDASRNNLNMIHSCDEYLKSVDFAIAVLSYLDGSCTLEILVNLAKLLHALLTRKCYERYKILWYASLHSILYKDLWSYITSMKRITNQGSLVSLLSLVTKGALLIPSEAHDFYPLLTTFCWVFRRYLSMVHNNDLTAEGSDGVSVDTITEITVSLRDLGTTLLHIGIPVMPFHLDQETIGCNIDPMKDLYKVLIDLLKVLHSRAILPDQSIFETRKIYMPQMLSIHFDVELLSNHILYDNKTLFDISVISYNGAIKPYAILRDLPFCLPIRDRISILQEMFFAYKMSYQNPNELYQVTPLIPIRRGYIYEDAYERMSAVEVPEIRISVQVQLTSLIGHEEVGVDGGGIFREFMNEFLKAAFNPNRGFFLLNKDRQLYPNPNVHVLYPDFRKHYYFIGRMLAKALYENILVELPLAECFISSFVQREKDVNIYNLHSLDAELFKNLISLRSYDGDFSHLGLNYTVVSDLYGQTKVTELIQDGEKISVNKDNKVDYILHVADYKLNIQFEQQITYFRMGFSSVVPVFWLAVFSPKELQTLIFHSDSPINVEDLRKNCCYGAGYSTDHPNIIRFWRVINTFEDAEVKQLLKFVTTSSRQPLLGFKHLDPPFTIQMSEKSECLPTSSTCTNLLQLPVIPDEKVMREKLLYSIQSESGFDLC